MTSLSSTKTNLAQITKIITTTVSDIKTSSSLTQISLNTGSGVFNVTPLNYVSSTVSIMQIHQNYSTTARINNNKTTAFSYIQPTTTVKIYERRSSALINSIKTERITTTIIISSSSFSDPLRKKLLTLQSKAEKILPQSNHIIFFTLQLVLSFILIFILLIPLVLYKLFIFRNFGIC